MKALLIGECRNGKVLDTTYELTAFAQKIGAESVMFIAGVESGLPKYEGKLYLADSSKYGEFRPDVHQKLISSVVKKENPDVIVISHSYYGWDLAPRLAFELGCAQVSEVIDYEDGFFHVPACNSKMRRSVKPKTPVSVVTIQSGAFNPADEPSGTPSVEKLDEGDIASAYEVGAFEIEEDKEVDLTKAEVIVSAGRGVGKKENVEIVANLAKSMGCEMGASRPVVDAGWTESFRQVGTSGQTVSPKLYIACGISGAIQHLAGMKKSEFIVAINTDKEAPIGDIADVLVVADLKEFLPIFAEKVKG